MLYQYLDGYCLFYIFLLYDVSGLALASLRIFILIFAVLIISFGVVKLPLPQTFRESTD
jgi:hypothetical protein